MKRNACAGDSRAWLSVSVILASVALCACSSSNCPNGRMGDTGACLAEPATVNNAATSAARDADSAAAGGKSDPDERGTDAG